MNLSIGGLSSTQRRRGRDLLSQTTVEVFPSRLPEKLLVSLPTFHPGQREADPFAVAQFLGAGRAGVSLFGPGTGAIARA